MNSTRMFSAKKLLLLSMLGASVGCGSDPVSSGGVPANTNDAMETYASLALSTYQDSLSTAKELDQSITDFLADPSEDGFEAAKEAWLAAREPYLQTEVFRFYDGPIDNPDDGPEGLINAWPLDEFYIDYVVDDAMAGIINDPDVEISAEELVALNEQGGEKNIATGFHAIEFLLWGQDLSADGPGARPYTDYVPDGGTAENQDRRGEYLSVVSGLLVEHLASLVDAWEDGEENYRAEFLAEEPEEALRRVLTGMTVLTGFETGRERIAPALDQGDQEDEHSCFSDNTHRDMVQDVQGVLNVWKGEYSAISADDVSGTSIEEVVMAADRDLADTLDEQIQMALDRALALEPPFDQEIRPDNEEGNERVASLIAALEDVEQSLQELFEVLELDIPETD